jgi:hypothetical protein
VKTEVIAAHHSSVAPHATTTFPASALAAPGARVHPQQASTRAAPIDRIGRERARGEAIVDLLERLKGCHAAKLGRGAGPAGDSAVSVGDGAVT